MTNSSGVSLSNNIEIFVLNMSLSCSKSPWMNGAQSITLTIHIRITNCSLFISETQPGEFSSIDVICSWKNFTKYWLLCSLDLMQRNKFCNLQKLIAQFHLTESSSPLIRFRHVSSKLNNIAWVASDFQMDKSFS